MNLDMIGRSMAVLLACAVCIACGGSPDQDLQAATRDVSEARAELKASTVKLEEREKALEAARVERDKARAQVAEAQKRVDAAQKELETYATDGTVFRAVQKRLLEDKGLESVAIAARVENGIVSLSGVVPNQRMRDRASAVARETPGVADVNNQIVVKAPAVAAKK